MLNVIHSDTINEIKTSYMKAKMFIEVLIDLYCHFKVRFRVEVNLQYVLIYNVFPH